MTCHDEWTRVYASVEWKAEAKDQKSVWTPIVSYGPDLTLKAIDPKGDEVSIVTVPSNAKVKLFWRTSPESVFCEAEGGWSGPKTTNGEEEVAPTFAGINTYVLRCHGKNGLKSVAFVHAIAKGETLP
jgi:hypothetical protein